jgi:poly-gamma-glutamate capsule biosynthesis protein CapA/YwtB (metallophosphatase superfamily)
MINIVIGGDICPSGSIQSAFVEGNAREIFHDLLDEIAGADLSIVNLECPLVSRKTPIAKAGPVLGAPVGCIQGFIAGKWNVLNLANNHSFDHGANGLRQTIHAIEEAGLGFVGAGSNIKEAQKPYIKEIRGQRIVIYAMAEREFSIADANTPGANPLDLINFMKAIRQYKQQGIFIVLIHGGKEYYPYPSPEMVRRCHFMVDMGADAVICCHTHCPLPWEIYADRPIVYGLGNLIFEAGSQEPDCWYEGYLARLTVDNTQIRFEAIPYSQSQMHRGARKMNQDEQRLFFNEMETKSTQVKDTVFIESEWTQYCMQQRDTYLVRLFGYNRLMQKMGSLLLKKLHSKKKVLHALIRVQCETHREILNTIFREERRNR